MSSDQNFRELSINVISHHNIYVKREICEWQFSSFIVILSEKHVNFGVISREIAEITWMLVDH